MAETPLSVFVCTRGDCVWQEILSTVLLLSKMLQLLCGETTTVLEEYFVSVTQENLFITTPVPELHGVSNPSMGATNLHISLSPPPPL